MMKNIFSGWKKKLSVINFLPRLNKFCELQRIAEPLGEDEKGIFIDCGAFDGCSAIKFLLANPRFDSVSFEPNPEMWGYYGNVPTTLIRKGVSWKQETLQFYLDHIDGDGSSAIAGKEICFGRPEENENCEAIEIDCVGVPGLITEFSKRYDKIILKLDVEGSEYDILEELLASGSIDKVDKLYVEFHWFKCGFSEDRHRKLSASLLNRVKVADWDGTDYSIHNQGIARRLWRDKLVADHLRDVTRYQCVKVSLNSSA